MYSEEKSIMEQLQIIFRDVFDDETIVLTLNTNADQIEGWDSLAQIRLVAAIENKFNIKFGYDELKEIPDVGGMIKIMIKKI